MRLTTKALLCASAMQLAAAANAAPGFTRVVAFGDSYADIGNVKALTGAAFPSTIYPTGRFSGGTNFVDTLATHYNAPIVNFAFGGAQAGSVNISSPLLPGFAQEIPLFASRTGGTLVADDLVALSVGGNDARAYRIGGGTLAGVDAATTQTARDAAAGIQTLVTAGARHVVFLAGDAGQLPEALGQANAAVGTAFSTAYNTKIEASLAGIAQSGVTIAYVDITAIGNDVRANPARFGFSNVNTPCPLACVGNPTLQSQYFFYVDGVHLTSAAFDLVGRYAINQLEAPYGFRADGDVVQNSARDFGRTLEQRLDAARGDGGHDGFAVYGQFVGGHAHFEGNATSDGYRYGSTGAAGGAEWRQGRLTAGATFAWTHDHADGAGVDRAKARSYQLGGYAGVESGGFFAQVYGGYGWHHLDLRRSGVADPLTAAPHATSWVAGAAAGWLVDVGPARIGPVAELTYVRGRIAGYAEAGDAAAALTVQRQRFTAATGAAGLEIRSDLAGLSPWLRVTAEGKLDGDGRSVRYAPSVAPTIVNRFTIGDRASASAAVSGGISAHVAGRLTAQAAAHATFAGEGNGLGGFVGLRIGL